MHFPPFYTKQFGVIVTINYQSSLDKSTAIVSIENSKLKAVVSVMGWPFQKDLIKYVNLSRQRRILNSFQTLVQIRTTPSNQKLMGFHNFFSFWKFAGSFSQHKCVVGWSISQNCRVRSSCLSSFMERKKKEIPRSVCQD